MARANICPACGWQNDLAAIRCGGCGGYLGAPVTSPGVDNTRPITAHSTDLPTSPPSYSDPATRSAIMPAYDHVATSPAHHGVVGSDQPPRWPGNQQQVSRLAPRQRHRQRALLRWLFGLGLSLVVLAAIASVLWLMLLRPYLHSRVDGAISDALNQAIASLPSVSDQDLQSLTPTVTISDAETSTLLARDLPTGTGLDRLGVAFQPGVAVMTYSAYGQQGTIQTGFQTQGGELVASGTQVSGALSWVESGDELRATLDQALTELTAKTPHGFQSVQIASGAMTVTIKTK